MKIGVREICDVVFRTKAPTKIGNKIFYKSEPVLYFDSLKTSSLEGAATTVYAQGGKGNTRLMAWVGERTITFNMEDALISPESLAILIGAGIVEASYEIVDIKENYYEYWILGSLDTSILYKVYNSSNEFVEVYIQANQNIFNENSYIVFEKDLVSIIDGNTLSIELKEYNDEGEEIKVLKPLDGPYEKIMGQKEKPVSIITTHTTEIISEWNLSGEQFNCDLSSIPSDNINTSIYIFPLKNGEIISEPFIALKSGIIKNKVIVKSIDDYVPDLSYFENCDSVLVDYYVDHISNAMQIDITPDRFGSNFYVEASTLFRDTNGVDIPAEFIIPNCKVQSNFTFTTTSSGDPSTFNFVLDAFPDYTRFDKTKKVLAAIQIINSKNDIIDKNRKSTPAKELI